MQLECKKQTNDGAARETERERANEEERELCPLREYGRNHSYKLDTHTNAHFSDHSSSEEQEVNVPCPLY